MPSKICKKSVAFLAVGPVMQGHLIAAFPVLEDPWMCCNDAYRLPVHMVLFIREISLFNFVTQQIMISLLFGCRYGYLLIGLALGG